MSLAKPEEEEYSTRRNLQVSKEQEISSMQAVHQTRRSSKAANMVFVTSSKAQTAQLTLSA
jgi:hypothetical protein